MTTSVERLVTDLPIWTDCPFAVPKEIEVRRGKFDQSEPEMISFWHPLTQRHVDLIAESLTTEDVRAACGMLKP